MVATYRELFLRHLDEKRYTNEPVNLYEPINYILDLGGKRMRPILTLMVCDLFGGEVTKALDAAMAVEVFHNFTLIHDDIMDSAPLRRGKNTVHKKWDINTGILSGDAMMILAFQTLETYKGDEFRNLMSVLIKTSLEVCEGQQYDIDFETRSDVTIEEYLKMIEYKTAVLVGAAMKMGAIVANASQEDQNNIYEFGKNLGIAFQLQDDYLDAFGNPETFGKQIGGDIIENKKTFLYIKALQLANKSDQKVLLDLYSLEPKDVEDKIKIIKEIFISSGASEATQQEIQNYTQIAFNVLENLAVSQEKKNILKQFGEQLMKRNI